MTGYYNFKIKTYPVTCFDFMAIYIMFQYFNYILSPVFGAVYSVGTFRNFGEGKMNFWTLLLKSVFFNIKFKFKMLLIHVYNV